MGDLLRLLGSEEFQCRARISDSIAIKGTFRFFKLNVEIGELLRASAVLRVQRYFNLPATFAQIMEDVFQLIGIPNPKTMAPFAIDSDSPEESRDVFAFIIFPAPFTEIERCQFTL